MNELTEICRAPQPIILFVAWGISVLTSIITLPVGIARLRKCRSVVRLIAINRVIGVGAGLICLCSLIGQVNLVLLMQGTTTPSAAQAEIAAFALSRVLNLLSVSVLVCGINGLIAVAFDQRWKDPQ
jgi:hypothetical protein